MARDKTFGDHLTVLAAARIFNVQFLVMSTLGVNATRLITPGPAQNYNPDVTTLLLGHYAETGGGLLQHYVSLDVRCEKDRKTIIDKILANIHSASSPVHDDVAGTSTCLKESADFDDHMDTSVCLESLDIDILTNMDNVSNAVTGNKSEAIQVKGEASVCYSTGSEKDPGGLDIGCYVDKISELDDRTKSQLLDNHWYPNKEYILPFVNRTINGKVERRYLRHSHLERCSYLSYSVSKQGLYCRPCVIFGPASMTSGGQMLHTLVKTPLKKYDRMFGKNGYITCHTQTEYHKMATVRCAQFRSLLKNKIDISKQIDTRRSEQGQRNRLFLSQIIKTIIFCGKQNLSLREHRDDGLLDMNQAELSDQSADRNDGNFRALLRFRIEAGDNILESHLRSSARNAMYTSKTVQNELIECISEVMRQSIVQQVRFAKFFSVLADETTDAGRKEQLSICVRYVHDNLLREEFLDFMEVTDLTGHGLGNTIMTELTKRGLDLGNLVGQGYDGASAMSGRLNGAQATICGVHSQAQYVHCASHVLNLSLSSGCTEQAIRNAMGVISTAANFFSRSAKRTNLLQSMVSTKVESCSKKQRLLRLCETRWVERHDAILTFVELFDPLVECLTECLALDRETATSAQMLLNSMARPEFIVATCSMNQVLAITKSLSVNLQKVGIDLIKALKLVDNVIDCLCDKRSADDSFRAIWNQSSQMAEGIGAELNQPRQVPKQQNRVNIQCDSDEEYFRRSVYFPFVNHVISELRSRFNVHQQLIANTWCLIPKFLKSYSFATLKPTLVRFSMYLDSEEAVHGEFDLWQKRWSTASECPETAIESLVACDIDLFPNIHCLLKIIATLPVTTASAERTFSALKRLKTYLRSTMGDERLSGLAHMHIQYSSPIDIDAVIDVFVNSGRARRLNFILLIYD